MTLKPRALRTLLSDAQRRGIDLYAPNVLEQLRSVAPWPAEVSPGEEQQALEALRALRALATEQTQPTTATAVATAKSSTGLPRIDGTLRRLFQRCQSNLLVMSLTYSEDMMRQIEAVAKRGPTITVVGNESDPRFRHLIAYWPCPTNMPRALVARDVNQMHIKAAVADRKYGYLGSGNLTEGGLRHNMELGIDFDGALAEQIWTFVDSQLRSGHLVSYQGGA